MIHYNLIHAKRKTIAIHIKDGIVTVRAPLKMPQSDIDDFVSSKIDWIHKNLAISKKRRDQKASFVLDYGKIFIMRGIKYTIYESDKAHAYLDAGALFLPPGLSPAAIKATVIQTYKTLAKQHIVKRTMEIGAHMNIVPAAVKINSAKTRWGSCTSEGNLNFSWRLMMADDTLIDYVIVHELCHLWELNHSDRFWALVADVLPDYKKRRAALNKLSKQLASENW